MFFVIADEIPHVIGILAEETGADNLICPAGLLAKIEMHPFPFIALQLLHQGNCCVLILLLFPLVLQGSPFL
jgi:hypothetical protein